MLFFFQINAELQLESTLVEFVVAKNGCMKVNFHPFYEGDR